MISDVPDIDYIQKAKDLISDDGWDFAAIVDSAKTLNFVDEIRPQELCGNNFGSFEVAQNFRIIPE